MSETATDMYSKCVIYWPLAALMTFISTVPKIQTSGSVFSVEEMSPLSAKAGVTTKSDSSLEIEPGRPPMVLSYYQNKSLR